MSHEHDHRVKPRAPLWKWLVIILVVVAMPMFFSFYREAQLEQAIEDTDATPPNEQTPPTQN